MAISRDEWWKHVETDSQGAESFNWSYTYGTSFKKFRENAKKDRNHTLHLHDRYERGILYTITAGELSDGLRNHTFKVIVPAAQGCAKLRDELRKKHPKWVIELGRSTRGSGTPFIHIPVEHVTKRNSDTDGDEEIETESDGIEWE